MNGNCCSLIPDKHPVEVLDYAFDWSLILTAPVTISTATITVPPGITLSQPGTVSGYLVNFQLSGGVAPAWYLITCTITTSDGRTFQRSFNLRVD